MEGRTIVDSRGQPCLRGGPVGHGQTAWRAEDRAGGTYPPFNFKDAKQQLTGFDVEIATEIARRMKVKPEFVTAEWSGLLAGLQSGKFDIVVNQVGVTAQRQAVFDFSQPYTYSSAQLIVRKNESRDFKNLADLKGKSSASARAATTPTWPRRLPACR